MEKLSIFPWLSVVSLLTVQILNIETVYELISAAFPLIIIMSTSLVKHKFKYMGQNRLLLSYIFHVQGDGLKFHRNIVNAFTWFKSKLNITCCGRTACNGILKMFISKYDSYSNVSFMVMLLKCINSKKYPFMHYVCIGPFIKLEINFRHFGHGSIRISTKRAYDY